MLKFLEKRGRGARILLGLFGGAVGLAMVITLVPGTYDGTVQSADAVATVGSHTISISQVQTQLQQIARGNPMPPQLRAIYAEQVVEQLVFEQMLDIEAERMGIRVTPQEQAERIRKMLPSAASGNTDQYRAEVTQRTGLTVPAFEDQVRRWALREKFVQLVTDGVTITPEELDREFRRRTEKIKIEYALVQPDTLFSQIHPAESELAAYFEKNKTKYQVPEQREIRFARISDSDVRSRINVTDNDLRAFYNENIESFRLQNRTKVRRILFKTLGKTEAEVEETRRKAEEVLKQARRPGAKFDELARQHSEDDNSKANGGDIGWIIEGQTEPEFQRAAFSVPKGAVSDLVKTSLGFDILKVEDREQARTRSLEEVRAEILPRAAEQIARRELQSLEDNVANSIRSNSNKKLDELAAEFKMEVGQAGPAGVRDVWGPLGFSPEIDDAVFRLRPGELSSPMRLENGFLVLELKQTLPAHQGTLDEVRNLVIDDYRREKAGELAKARAEELAAKAKAGTSLAAAAKAAGLTVKTSEPIARTGSLPDIGSVTPLAAAFSLAPGETGPATSLGANWIVYRVVSRETIKPEEVAQELRVVQDAVLQKKRQVAYEAFREALRKRMTDEGVLRYNEDNFKRLTNPGA